MKTAGNLVVLGSINADHILNLNSFPTPGETVTGSHYQVAFGGKGANQAVAAGRSGANIAFIACTGHYRVLMGPRGAGTGGRVIPCQPVAPADLRADYRRTVRQA